MKNFFLTVIFCLISFNALAQDKASCLDSDDDFDQCLEQVKECGESVECLVNMFGDGLSQTKECKETQETHSPNLKGEARDAWWAEAKKCVAVGFRRGFRLNALLLAAHNEKKAYEIGRRITDYAECRFQRGKEGDDLEICMDRLSEKPIAHLGDNCDSFFFREKGVGEVYFKFDADPQKNSLSQEVEEGVRVQVKDGYLSIRQKGKVLVTVRFSQTETAKKAKMKGRNYPTINMTCEQ